MKNIERICIVVASEMTVTAFLINPIKKLSEEYDVTLIVNTKRTDFAEQNGLSIQVIPLAIERRIKPARDIMALYRLICVFRRHRFDLVHSVTPKAGLLAMLAGKIAGIRFRIHTFTGQVWATRSGMSRLLLKSMDRLLAACASQLLADSASQQEFLIAQGVVAAGKVSVLAHGSICGVDTARFHPDADSRKEVRRELGFDVEETVFLFLGRLNRDKGVLDLAQAFACLPAGCRLLFVGPDEAGMQAEIEGLMPSCAGRISFITYTDKPESYMAAADVFCLPSYREGFGSVIIEAAACGIPAIGSRIYGVRDAIEEGESGLLFTVGDIADLRRCMQEMLENETRRLQMGEYARERAQRDFSSARVTQAWLEYYDALL